MKKIFVKTVFCCLVTLGLCACGASLPDCDSAQVIKLLKSIVKDQTNLPFASQSVVELKKVSAIRTIKREDKTCQCVAVGTFAALGQTMDEKFSYTIEMADNNDEFIVTMFAD